MFFNFFEHYILSIHSLILAPVLYYSFTYLPLSLFLSFSVFFSLFLSFLLPPSPSLFLSRSQSTPHLHASMFFTHYYIILQYYNTPFSIYCIYHSRNNSWILKIMLKTKSNQLSKRLPAYRFYECAK